MFNYRFPKDAALLASVMAHFPDESLGIEAISLMLNGAEYVMQTAQEIPEEQLEHLQMVKVD